MGSNELRYSHMINNNESICIIDSIVLKQSVEISVNTQYFFNIYIK